jgi:hypothetical protein
MPAQVYRCKVIVIQTTHFVRHCGKRCAQGVSLLREIGVEEGEQDNEMNANNFYLLSPSQTRKEGIGIGIGMRCLPPRSLWLPTLSSTPIHSFATLVLVLLLLLSSSLLAFVGSASTADDRAPHEPWLAIVIPYRDRAHHLAEFLEHAVPFIHTQVRSARVFLVEQEFGEKFNRGLLLNIGFVVAAGRGFDYFAMHDVDMVPSSNHALNHTYPWGPVYQYTKHAVHLATAAEQFQNRLPYYTYVGGVLLLTTYGFATDTNGPTASLATTSSPSVGH